jgi:Flp pilus assembly protein TadG
MRFSRLRAGLTSVGRFRSNDRGGVPLLFVFSLLPLLVAAGGAIDLSEVYRVKDTIVSKTDAAALAAVSAQALKPELTWAAQKAASVDVAKRVFEEGVTGTSGFSVSSAQYTTDAVDMNLTVKICWKGKQKTAFLRFVGKTSWDIEGCSESTASAQEYVSVVFLVDASGSMGVGATEADQRLMENRFGCAFACHTFDWVSNVSDGCNKPTTTCAAYIGAKTRFQVVKEALKSILFEGQANAKVPDQFTFAIYKFSNDLTLVQRPTDQYATLRASVDGMQQDETGGTNLSRALDILNRQLPTPGDGKTPTTRKVFLILMTDGVEGNVLQVKSGSPLRHNGEWSQDSRLEITSPGFTVTRPMSFAQIALEILNIRSVNDIMKSERSQAINPSRCDAIKNRGITIGTLNTEYLIPPWSTDSRFLQIRTLLSPVIADTMRRCASDPTFALFATRPDEITAAANKLFKQFLTTTARLSR